MDDRRRTLAAITVIIGFLVLVAVIVAALVSGKKVVSPVPEDTSVIKIIFVTPKPTATSTLTPATTTATPTQTPTATPTP